VQTEIEETMAATVLWPEIDGDAQLLLATAQPVGRVRRTFARHCGLYAGVDYAAALGVAGEPAVGTGELLPPLVFARVQGRDSAGQDVDVFYEASTPPAGTSWPALTVRLDDDGLALWVEAQPAHLIAQGDFSSVTPGTDNPSVRQPVVDWREMVLTAMVATNRRLEVTRSIGMGETLVIEVPDAELWWAAERTAVGVRADGSLALVPDPEGLVLRDDRALVRTVATMAAAWYSRERIALDVVVRSLGGAPQVGTLVRSITSGGRTIIGGTVVTEVRILYGSSRTTLRTAWGELDALGIVGLAARGGSAGTRPDNSPSSGAGERIPVRWAQGGGGGGGVESGIEATTRVFACS